MGWWILVVLVSVPFLDCYMIIDGKSYEIIPFTNNINFQNETTILISSLENNLTGKFVHYEASQNGFNEEIANIQSKGALGVVLTVLPNITSLTPNLLLGYAYLSVYVPQNSITIPVGMLGNTSASTDLANVKISNATFTGWSPNEWRNAIESPLFKVYWITFTCFFIINVLLALKTIINWFIFYNRIELSIGIICLIFELCGNISRIFQIIFVPLPLYNRFYLPCADILQTFPYPFTISGSILLSFFWLDLTSGSFYQGRFLSTMKIPAIVTICVLFGLELIFDIIRVIEGQYLSSAYVTGLEVVFLLLHFIMSIFYYYASYKVLLTIKDLSPQKAKFIRRITYKIIASATVTVVTTCVAIVWALPVASSSVTSYYVIWVVVFFTFFPQSLFQILSFQVPKTGQTGKTSSSTNKSQSHTTSKESSIVSDTPREA